MTSTTKLVGVLKERRDNLKEWIKEPDLHKPISFGIPEIDAMIFGGAPREPFYFALIGSAKQGKTTIELNLALNFCAISGESTALYMLEENRRQIADRVFARSSDLVSRSKLFQLALGDEEFIEMERTIDDFEDTKFYVNDSLNNITAILADAESIGVKRIVIDNFQLMTGGGGMDERTRLVAQSQMIMRARQRGLTTFLVSQGNDKGESFGSKQVQMDADLVIGITSVRTDENDKKSAIMTNMRKLKVTQSRFSSQGEECTICFDGNHSRILQVPIKKPENIEFPGHIINELLAATDSKREN